VRIGANQLVFRGADTLRRTTSRSARSRRPCSRRGSATCSSSCSGRSPSREPFTEPASTRDIATSRVVSEAAVNQHLARLYDKFGIHACLDRRRMRLANEAPRRAAVSIAELRNRFDQPDS